MGRPGVWEVGGRRGKGVGGCKGRGATYSLAKLVFHPAILLDPREVRLPLLFCPDLRRPRDAVLEARVSPRSFRTLPPDVLEGGGGGVRVSYAGHSGDLRRGGVGAPAFDVERRVGYEPGRGSVRGGVEGCGYMGQ